MEKFLLEYGLFVAKIVTFLGCILLMVFFVTLIIYSKKKPKEESYIEIDNINDKFEDLRDNIEAEILDSSEYKKLQKAKKKRHKLEKAQKKSAEIPDSPKPKIFVLTFDGDLHASTTDNLREEISAILTVAKETDQVFIKVNSSGGIVHNYGLAAAQLQRIKKHKINLVASVDLIAASGGYMIASVADKIIAAPFAILGSIGVLAQIPNFNKLLQKHHVDIEHHTSGEYKTTLTLLGKNTSKGREKFVQELEDTHDLFKNFVKINRPNIDINQIATGEYWYGTRALALNLIDEIQLSDEYLMLKSTSCDIYAVEHKVHESLKDKITHALIKSVQFCLDKVTKKTILT